ncbi:MAG: dethiobiotin synthase [Gammaproteobacteria bacterium SHHR-1]|uniref:dethiobiotin synthase n=1 Tax=Magnetovirga frankeli TaxID=947516 RepID=UPI001293E139|nr:dethiobiotin synthase [gamma proteobacterium SS-5]
MTEGYFVTGTDTDVGKTELTLGLMAALQARGKQVLGMKPVAAGCDWQQGRLVNADALRIQRQCSRPLVYEMINPIALEPAIAPHLAAAEAGVEISFDAILRPYQALRQQTDWLIVEGAGGWRVPLGRDGDMGDLAQRLGLPVILVVGMRLGCLNHALLSLAAIQAQGCPLAGWVANGIDPRMQRLEQNLASLEALIPAPCLGRIAYMQPPTPERIAPMIDL